MNSEEEYLIDRVFKTKLTDHDEAEIEQARALMQRHRNLLGRQKHRHAPDAIIAAQLLSIAPWRITQLFLLELIRENVEPGDRDGWYITVALDRLAGIKAGTTREARKLFRLRKTQPDPDSTNPEEFRDAIARSLSQNAKRMR